MLSKIEQYIPTFKTTDAGWIRFYEKLRAIFSKKETNKYWMQAWENTGGVANYNANTAELRTYMKKKGIDIAAPTTWQGITDTATDIYGIIRVYVWIAVIIIITGAALKLFVFNNPKTSLRNEK